MIIIFVDHASIQFRACKLYYDTPILSITQLPIILDILFDLNQFEAVREVDNCLPYTNEYNLWLAHAESASIFHGLTTNLILSLIPQCPQCIPGITQNRRQDKGKKA